LRSGRPRRSSPRTPRAVLGVATLTAPVRGGLRALAALRHGGSCRGLRAQAASSLGDSRLPPNGPVQPLSHRGAAMTRRRGLLAAGAAGPEAAIGTTRRPPERGGLGFSTRTDA
jgi:hypothetical protein